MPDCLFCKIAAGEIPANVVYRDADVVGILDIHPRALGHTMVIPKKHAETILELSENELGNLFSGVKKVTSLLADRLHPDGFTIGINHGKAAGQAVDHLHVHVIPRQKDDGGTSLHGVVAPPAGGFSQSLDEVQKNIVQQEGSRKG